MSEDKNDLQEANPFVTGASKILNKMRGGKTMEVIPPKGPSVNIPRGATGTEIATAAPKAGSGLKPVGIGTAAAGAAAVGAGTYAYQQAKKDTADSSVAGRTGVGMNKVMNRGETSTPPKPTEPAKTEPAKPISFSQAFKTAREKAGGAGGKFTFNDKEYQTNVKGEKYQPASKLKSVDTTSSVDAPVPPKRPEDLPKTSAPETPASTTPKTDDTSKVTTPKTESGGKKKMSEENNKLIDMFLRLQEKNTLTPNIFEAAKKAKKDYDGDGKVESPKDEVWGSRFRAAKAAGKMEEGAGDETAKKETSMSVTMDNKPSTPAQTTAATSGPSASDKKALDTKIKSIAKEEVEFSQAEIDHINSFFEAVAPSRAEPTKGVNPTVRNTDLTDETLEELTGKGKLPGILRSIENKQAKLKRIADRAEYLHAASNKNDSHKGPDSEKKFYMRQAKELRKEEVELEEGRPRKNPTPETTERDARQHIQVQAGRAAGGTVVDFKHDDGKISKLTPGMGRRITAHLNGLKPAERQEAVKRMHASPEGLKV